MSVEISTNEPELGIDKSSKEISHQPADGHLVVNGISNGYGEKHKKDHKSDHKDKDRHKDKHKHKDHKDRDKEKEKHRDKSTSGKDKEKEKHSSSSSSSKDRDKEKKHKDERKEREREHKSSSSSSKDKEHRSSSSFKEKEKHSSSSSNKDKDRHTSSHRDKEKEKEKEKDRHSSSSKEKEKHHSSSSREKEKHGSSSEKKHSDKDKHKNKEKEKELKEKGKTKPDEHKDKDRCDELVFKNEVDMKTEVLVPEGNIKSEPESEVDREIDDSLVNDYGDSTAYLSDSKIKSEDSVTFRSDDDLKIKSEEDTEDDVPLWPSGRKMHRAGLSFRAVPQNVKRINEESDDDDVPLFTRKKIKNESSTKRKAESDEDDFKPDKKKKVKSKSKDTKSKSGESGTESPKKGKKKEEEQQEVWKWWEEEKKDDGSKWSFLQHKGPVFAPPYERLPPDVKFFYDGKEIRLSEEAEEVATFYARMLDHEYTTKEAFNKNFFKDWRKVMTDKEKELITDLSKCNFKHMHAYFLQKSEERKAMSKEEKKKIKEQNEELIKDYGYCVIDGHKERIGNFRIEPPGLFRGRGEHPKMGMLKKRVQPEDVIINCSKDSVFPKAPEGHKWREIRHDKNVTWLASWTENVQGQVKYVMLNPSSKLKGEKDWQKYETARKLAKSIDKIRAEYHEDWKSKEMRIRQRAVALYFIDKLALRAGNEKDEDQADTVGCCSLRVEHISLHEQKDGKDCVVVFDFLGKDSIRYYNEVSVEKRVFKNLQLFMQNKSKGDDLFDRLNTTVLNKHLNELMEGLTAKVFRTYNASITLQQQLKELTNPDYTTAEKILAYNRANRAVAILCNHQRAVPKSHAKSMENLKTKIETKKEQLEEAEKQYKQAKREHKNHGSAKNKIDMDKRKKILDRIKEQLAKLEVQATDKEENKEIALGTSKLNYLDPRITVAWCKKFEVPIDKIYNKTQREKFRWAIDMAGPDYIF